MTTPLATTNIERVNALAALLKALPIPQDEEEATADDGVSREILPDLYFALVAVCHQTSPLGEPALAGTIGGQNLRGWDYLRTAFLKAASAQPGFLQPARLADFSVEQLDQILQVADQPVHLNRLEERAMLLRDIGSKMLGMGVTSITDVFELGERQVAGENGILNRLSAFHAYRDPVRKKSVFFLALMWNQRLWSLRDPETIPAPVDYHEVRGHLRIGTVNLEPGLAERLAAGRRVSELEDIAIRSAVADVLGALAADTGLTQSRLHYLFWNVFRNCCKRDITHCAECPPACSLPDRYAALTSEARRCVFSSACASKNNPIKLVEHDTDTDFY